MSEPTYLAWQLDRKRPVAPQLNLAVARFERRLGRLPTELLVPAGSGWSWPGLLVREERRIPAGQVWLGANLEQEPALAEEAA